MLIPCDDARRVRDTFAGFPTGLAALAAVVEDTPTVLVASSFAVGISQHPPLVLFAVQHTSTTWPLLATAAAIGVSVLGERHAGKVRQLAATDKLRRLDGVPTLLEDSGAIFLHGAPVWLECSTEHTYPAGDHDIVVLRVHRMRTDHRQDALVWHRSQLATLAKDAG
jgi:flavin reductase (DIM6/NTAB) family NADH-FMN oxidoreductase RutF